MVNLFVQKNSKLLKVILALSVAFHIRPSEIVDPDFELSDLNRIFLDYEILNLEVDKEESFKDKVKREIYNG